MSSSYRYFWRIISACLFMLSASVYADYTVSGAQNADINGTYVLDIDRDNVPSYIKTGGGQTWYLYRFSGRWYVKDNDHGMGMMGYYSNSSADTPPETGWHSMMDPGTITVLPAGPGVTYSSKQFTESLANDGSIISEVLTLTHNNIDDAFAGTDGEDFIATGKANISNLPAGLTASLTRQSALTLQLQLSGAAIAAAQTNNVNTLTVQLTDAAFASGNAAANSNAKVENLTIQFRDSLSVGSTGTYSTIAAAVAAAKNYDILDLAAETFTEKNININKSLVIQGQGAGSTIVQAMATPRETTGRIFEIQYNYSSSEPVQIKRLTLQNGYITTGDGGVIDNYSAALLLEDCHIKNNAMFSPSSNASGGAVYAKNRLVVRRCLFDSNLVEASTGKYAEGGAIYGDFGSDITIENSTFTNNEAKTPTSNDKAYGAAIHGTTNSKLTVINSTITGNKTSGYAAGISKISNAVAIQNSIIYGNTANFRATDADIYSQNGVNISYSLIGARSTHANDVVANELSANPLFDVLADNGGSTQTIALLSGSPAIAAGLMSEGIALDDQRGYCRINNLDLGAYQQNALGRAITYKANTAFGVAPTYACEMQYATADGLIKAGYSFAGWNTAADGSGTNYTAGDTIMLTAGSYVLYAQWQLPGYAVNYNANGATSGTAPAAQVKQPGVTLLLSNNSGNLVKTNYSFAGWNSAADGTGTAYAVGANYEIDADLTLYAQWAANQFTLSFDSAGGSAVAPIVADFGAAITPPANPTRTGYSFTGWTPALPATMPAANTSVTAQWAVNQFTLSFDSAGGSAVAPIVADFGAAITPPANPTRVGYSFIGWTPALPATMPAANTSVTAQWAVNQFTLSFDSAGGSAVSAITADFGAAITPPANPTRAGYSFTGWTPALPATMPAANTSVTAQWAVNQFTLSFDSAGGSAVAPIVADFGAAITPPANPTRVGYSFIGWTPALPATMPAANTSVTAQWAVNQFTLSFDSAGGSAVSAITADFGAAITPPANPTRTGYSFTGWTPALPATMPAANTSVTAQWAVNQFTLSFDSAGGSAVSAITADFGVAITPPANPTRTGYSFTGWTPALPATMPAANTSVTAQWAVNQFTLSFDSAGGSAVAPIVADFGAAITPPANPTRVGYSFIGWTPALPATMPAANTSVTAQWAVNQFTLSFDSAGGSAVSAITADFGAAITPPANPTRAGYSFTGWTPALPATMPAANTSVTAQWQQQSYTVSASITGNASISPASQQIKYGETAVFALNLINADAVVNIAGSCGAARTGNDIITAAITQSCNVQVSVYPASYVNGDISVPVSSGHAVNFTITGGAGDKELLSAKLMRADIETTLDLADVETMLTKSAEDKYQFSAMRTGLYTLVFRDIVSDEYIDVEITVLPYFAFSASAQPVTKDSMVNVKLWLSDEPAHYPVTAKLNIEGVEPTVISLTAAQLREYNHIVNVSAEQTLLLSSVTNALEGTPARHQFQLQNAPVALAIQAVATQKGEETIVISQDGGDVTLSALVLNGVADSYSWSSDSLDIAADTHDLVFNPESATVGNHKVTFMASNANGQQGQYLLNLQLISHCSEASCYSKTGLPASVSNNTPQRLPICPAGDEQCALAAQGYIETGGAHQLTLGEFSLAESWASMQFGAAVRGTLIADPDYVHHGVVVNFDITALGVPGESVPVVIALPEGQTIVADAIWRKYVNARWQDFVVNDRNLIESAAAEDNNRCPVVSSDTWQQGLTAGYACIRLTLEDGGPNDNDGQVNGVIQDPGVLAVKKDVVVIPEVPNTDTKPRSSGSTGVVFISLLTLLTIWRRRTMRLLLARAVS